VQRKIRERAVLREVLRRAGTFLVLLACFVGLVSPVFCLDIPKLQGYVNDYAGMISRGSANALEAELRDFEATDSTQIVILTVQSLEGEDLEGFSIRVADAWKIGHKVKDNGVILLVARQEKKIRIEVGRGLEGRLTDLMAGRIIDLIIMPRFKRGDFDGGFIAGIHSLIDATRGEFKSADSQKAGRGHDPSEFFTFLIFTMIVILVVSNISRVFGAVSGAVGIPLLASSFFSVGGLLIVILGAVGFFSGLLLPALFSSGGSSRQRRSSWPGGFYTGGGFGGGGGGFGGGGGGFGGGGGGFGGGGASGGW
jgi:uncharacterized protein